MTVGVDAFTRKQLERARNYLASLTTELEVLSPSEWAESKRYLPAALTSMPGPYSFELTPYLREPLDCLGLESPVREVVLMKGIQIGGTVGILENQIGYCVDHLKTAPVMLVTADAELAKLRMESYITPMLQASGLTHLIKSSDETSRRRSGKTDKKIEWIGGGFLVPFGAQNANKLRSLSIQILLRDEIDGWPDVVGKDGDPIKLSADRCAAYESSRKIFDLSSPTIKGQSKIEARFRLGDQRYYHVCCLACGHPQVLRWRREIDGVISGIVWELNSNGTLDHDSVRYLCEQCQHPHTNDDKTRLLNPVNGAQWKPTAQPASPYIRSYHISALYSPVGMQTWAACVEKWLEAWDVEHARPKDLGMLAVFYNGVLGESFELRGEKLRFENVSAHRRHSYKYGEVPNVWAKEHCGGAVQVLTCAVDVHKDSLRIAVFGWCRGRRAILVDYWTVSGDTEQLDDPCWATLTKLIEEKRYTADDGATYALAATFIDSGYNTDAVYQFCAQWDSGVFPIKGREYGEKNASIKEFSEFTSTLGTRAYAVTVSMYKDRWAAALRRGWDGHGLQPEGHFNAPLDVTDKQLKELTAETKREKITAQGKRIGWEWHRPNNAPNELWDTLIYNSAALDVLAWDLCVRTEENEAVDWFHFFEECEKQGLFLCG